jgi:probable poly-beta-1,6-N-acetyl-D-glucosamine export protein
MFAKRLFYLNGISILAVILNHAVGWGYTAMFYWSSRYQPVPVPNYEPMQSVTYYFLLFIKQLTVFSIPSFLAISGFFFAFAARGVKASLGSKLVWTRLINILIPYLIWSCFIFLIEFRPTNSLKLKDYLVMLLTGQASPIYYYVIIICQLILVSPLLVPIAKGEGWKKLLLISGIVQVAMILWNYLRLFNVVAWSPDLLFTNYLFFYVFGLSLGFHLDPIKGWLSKWKKALFICLIFSIPLAVIETEWIYRITGQDWRGGVITAASAVYAMLFLLVYLAYNEFTIPYPRLLNQLGQKTYGLYLLHPIVLMVVSKLIYNYAPMLLSNEIIFQTLLISLGVAIPMLIMSACAKTRFKSVYVYLFG